MSTSGIGCPQGLFLGFPQHWESLPSSPSTSDQSPMMSPACHLLILVRTVFKVSRQLLRPPPPLAGLASTHRASMKDLHQASKSEGSMVIALKTSYTMPAHASLAPFGTWWSVATLTPRIEPRDVFSVKTAPFTRCCAKRYSGAKRGYSAVTECAELRACAVGKGLKTCNLLVLAFLAVRLYCICISLSCQKKNNSLSCHFCL